MTVPQSIINYYPLLIHTISWCCVNFLCQWILSNPKIRDNSLGMTNSNKDKLLRGCGLPCYQKEGNEVEGNGGKLIFFLPPSGSVELMKSKVR